MSIDCMLSWNACAGTWAELPYEQRNSIETEADLQRLLAGAKDFGQSWTDARRGPALRSLQLWIAYCEHGAVLEDGSMDYGLLPPDMPSVQRTEKLLRFCRWLMQEHDSGLLTQQKEKGENCLSASGISALHSDLPLFTTLH